MGQAKRAGNGVKTGIHWKAIMQWLSFAYLAYITVGYCLVCPRGYIEYDILKSRMFIIPSVIFVFAEIIMWAVSLDKADHFSLEYRAKKDKIDFAMYALFVVWGISTLVSDGRHAAFWGDEFRYQGYLFFGLALTGMFLTSHIGGWNKVSTAMLMVVLAVIYVWQIGNYFGIDPFNWQMDRQYPLLVACLANIDQNSAFDGIAIAAGTAAFVFCKNKVLKVLWGIIDLLCVSAAITTRSDSFYFGLLLGTLIIVGYSLKHAEYIRSTAAAMAIYLAGIHLIKYLNTKFEHRLYFSIYYESAGSTLICSDEVDKVLAVLVVAFAVISVFYPKLPKKVISVIHMIYVVTISGGSIIGAIYVTKLYLSDSQSAVAEFAREALATREPIWRYSFINVGYQDLTHRLFGVGFGNFNRIMDRYSSVVYTIREYAELADAHNILIDFYVATGLIGAVAWLVLLACVVVKCRKAAGHYPWALIGVMLVAGVLATGFANTSLIIVTPWVYIGIGLMLYQVDLNEPKVSAADASDVSKPETGKKDIQPADPEESGTKSVTASEKPDVESMEWAKVEKKNTGKGKKNKKGKR